MTKRKEVWIKIISPEGDNKIASPEYIRELLRIPDLSNTIKRLNLIEAKIEKWESPERQKRIIEYLRGQGKHTRRWLRSRVDYRGYDLTALIQKGIIIESKSGTHRMLEVALMVRAQ